MHAAIAIMAAEDYIPQIPEGRSEDNFWQMIVETDILLFLRGPAHRSPPPCVRHWIQP